MLIKGMQSFRVEIGETVNEKNAVEKLALTLDELVDVHRGEELGAGEARANIFRGLVEVLENGEHSFNGLLITDDGYFLTTKQSIVCLGDAEVRLCGGKVYDFERVCFASTIDNVALAKAAIPGECIPKTYLLPQTGDLDEETVLLLAARYGRHIRISTGFVENPNNDSKPLMRRNSKLMYPHHFVLKFPDDDCKDAGGILMTKDGRIIGLSCWNKVSEETGDYLRRTGGIKMFNILEMICRYKEMLRR